MAADGNPVDPSSSLGPLESPPTGPLAAVPTIKMKWSIVIVAAVAVTATVSQIGVHLGWPSWSRPVISAAFALAAVQVLANGMTASLRQMVTAAKNMAKGNYRTRIPVDRNDEVGQLAVAFNQMAADLEATDRMQREFIANASAELRSPIGALTTTLQDLIDGVTRADRDTIGQMVSQSEHLTRLVDQLLDLSALESDENVLVAEPVDIGDVLHQTASDSRRDEPLALVEVKVPIGLRALGDEHRLHRLFANLIGNAVQFSPRGSPVTVTASRQNGSVRVAVRDLGPGIPEADRQDVFKRFWRADRSPSAPGGSGLGLAIAKHIVDEHHGSISINGNQPTGTCVVVTLPRSD